MSKNKEMLNKGVDTLEKGLKKADSILDQRKKLGAYSIAASLGVVAIAVHAVVSSLDFLITGIVVGAIALAPKIIRDSMKKTEAKESAPKKTEQKKAKAEEKEEESK